MASKERERWLRFQRDICKWLRSRGFTAHNFPPRTKVIKLKSGKTVVRSEDQDVFGCDIVARKIYKAEGAIIGFKEVWIQATLDTNVVKKIRQVSEAPLFPVAAVSNIDPVHTQIWLKRKGGNINIKQVVGIGERYEAVNVGKIIRGKFYAEEGVRWDY
jgi:hypothetical protein